MIKILGKNKGLLAALACAFYVGSYVIVWDRREVTRYTLTEKNGCIQTKYVLPFLRFAWMQSDSVQPVVTVLYWPVNAILSSQSN
jgi:hypothetical protein